MGDLPCPFSKIGKKCPNFGKNALIVVILDYISYLKYGFKSFQLKKKTKFFLAGPFFHVLLIKYLSKCPDSKTTPLSWKIPGYAPADRSTSVRQTLGWILKRTKISKNNKMFIKIKFLLQKVFVVTANLRWLNFQIARLYWAKLNCIPKYCKVIVSLLWNKSIAFKRTKIYHATK